MKNCGCTPEAQDHILGPVTAAPVKLLKEGKMESACLFWGGGGKDSFSSSRLMKASGDFFCVLACR